MSGTANPLQLTTVRDRPLVAGGVRVTPESQVLMLRLPFGGFVWHRPTAVVVERPGQTMQRVSIFDFTRAAQVSMLLGALLATVVGLIASGRQQDK
jgi:hypothetical protein